MQTVIETKALCKQYGPHTAVDHVELHVPQGCVYGFIGPNGAGKSTTMKMLLGLIHPTAGRVRLLGQELTEKSRLPLLRQTGSLIESPAGYLHLTAQENLEIVADLKGVPHKDIGRVLDIVHLTQDRSRRVGQYSLGMKQRLGIAMALLGTGEVLLMVTLEMAVSILLGRVQGYTEAFPAEPFVYTGICTLAVDVMLFFSELLLMLIFDNPMPALCVGIVGALIGLFSAFMPPLVSYFVPWGYFVPLSCYEVAYWDQATHTVTYGLRPYNWGLLAFTVVLAAALFAAAWRMMRDKEV